MNGRRLLILSVLSVTLGCQDHNAPTAPADKAPPPPSSMISDGANGGNPDFFFLPPMVPNPVNDPNYEAERFNDALGPRLTVEVCLLQGSPVDAQGRPVATDCVAGPPVKKFAAGTVRLLGMPDGFYQVSWNTRESNLDVTKYYRIKVLIEGSTTALGFADIDPMDNRSQVKNTRTGELIALIDDSTLPIKFRVEKSALCPGEKLCTSTVVTNHTPNGDPQIVQVVGEDGSAIAGVFIPDGFLPSTGPQSVVLSITRVNTGVNDVAAGTQSNPCHPGLPLQQFDSCFHFSTIPELATINENGDQFLKALTVAVCFVLHDTPDAREPWVQLWSSDEDGTDTKPLQSASDAQILAGLGGHDCGDDLTVASAPTSGLARFASAGWKKLRGGVSQLFGVRTAYAVDLGLGGLAFDLSNIGPALTAQIQRYTDTDLTLGPGATTTSTARIVGTRLHNGSPLTTGIGGLPVTFTVAPGNGTLKLIGSEAPGVSQLISTTNTNPIVAGDPTSGGGFAPVNWTLPSAVGTYTLTATAPALDGPVIFTAIVTAPPTARAMVSMQTGATIQLSAADVVGWASSNSAKISVSGTGLATAIVGGENSNGGDGATIGSVLASGAPGPVWLVNTPFDIFPRSTNAVWAAVPGAATYDVEIEYGNGCSGYANCGTWTGWNAASGIDGLNYAFVFVGTQPGRWRVTARDANGAVIPGSRDVTGAPIPNSPSPFVYFKYIDGL